MGRSKPRSTASAAAEWRASRGKQQRACEVEWAYWQVEAEEHSSCQLEHQVLDSHKHAQRVLLRPAGQPLLEQLGNARHIAVHSLLGEGLEGRAVSMLTQHLGEGVWSNAGHMPLSASLKKGVWQVQLQLAAGNSCHTALKHGVWQPRLGAPSPVRIACIPSSSYVGAMQFKPWVMRLLP